MNKLLFTTSIALAAMVSYAPAQAVEQNPHQPAIDACIAQNEYQPATLLASADDGMGDSTVWLTDADGDLWLCNGDAEGTIYANVMVSDDLLRGAGADLVTPLQDAAASSGREDIRVAEEVCTAVLLDQPARVVSSVPDGLSGEDADYIVFVEDSASKLHMCNASANAEIFAFVEIGGDEAPSV